MDAIAGIAQPERTGVIYGLFDPRDGVLRYVGQTICGLQTRYRGHFYDRSNTHRSNWIKSLRRQGFRPIPKILSEHPASELNDAEIAAIAFVRSTGAILLNHADGGMVGPISPETRLKISLKHRGRVQTEEHRKRNSVANKGRKHSAEHAEKIAATKRGKPLAAAHIAKVVAGLTGGRRTDTQRKRMSDAAFGRSKSPEYRLKMSESIKRSWAHREIGDRDEFGRWAHRTRGVSNGDGLPLQKVS